MIERAFDYKGIEQLPPWCDSCSSAPSLLALLLLVGAFVETVVTGLGNVQWLATGFSAGQMLPGLAIFTLLFFSSEPTSHFWHLILGAAVPKYCCPEVLSKPKRTSYYFFVNNFAIYDWYRASHHR